MKKIIFALIVCSFCLANSASAQEEPVVRIESSDGTSTEYEVDQLLRVELMGDSIRFIATDGTVAAEVYKYNYVKLTITDKSEGIEQPTVNNQAPVAKKVLIDGQVYILFDNKAYLITGTEVR